MMQIRGGSSSEKLGTAMQMHFFFNVAAKSRVLGEGGRVQIGRGEVDCNDVYVKL